MARKQRLLKFAIILWTPVLVIAAAGAYAGTFWYFFRGTSVLIPADSANGRYRAVVVRERDGHECESAGDTLVIIERRIGILKASESAPFCADKRAADGLSIGWSGATELTISCPHCSDGRFLIAQPSQSDVTLRIEH